jgi:hypothetical protein
VRNVIVEMKPMVPKLAFKSSAMVVNRGGSTKKRLWLRL